MGHIRSAAAHDRRPAVVPEGDPCWYKDAVIYEVHVRAFRDGNGDGTGDFLGLTEKLDYLQDLGVTAIWLLPFFPSPLKDDGYDIADFTDIHPRYGTLQEFKVFLREAHARDLRVITELIVNHTSDQHAWFQRSRRAKAGSPWRDFYVWSDTPERYQGARIIFKDFESSNWTWDATAKAYYWHRFYSHQPDLNYDSAQVRRAVLKVVDFWLGLGVDGLRLDAVPYLYERDGTTCENLPETHAFLRELRGHVDKRFTHRLLLAEANQWPEDASAYFGRGDECHVAFHFPLMPRLFMASRLEDRFPILDILQQTPAIPETCQWAMFLRNHDEMTLEMVTDEERDYMYRVYASDPQMRINLGIRRRLAPLLSNHRRKIELLNGLLFSMPGTPVIYYGDELGMGDNIQLGDRNGVRTPMQWSGDRNAGFSQANPQRLFLPVIRNSEYHYEAVNVEAQQNNPSSLLWWMKRLIALRKRYRALSRGTVEYLAPENRKILAFLRRVGEERVLVVANLSRFTQFAGLDLSACKGLIPVELFGQTAFPPIGDAPYVLTVGPHTFYWFSLEPQPAAGEPPPAREGQVPMIDVRGDWQEVLRDSLRSQAELERILPRYLTSCRWFGGKARTIRSAAIREMIALSRRTCVAFVEVEFTDAEAQTYLLPLSYVSGTATPDGHGGEQVIARLRVRGGRGAEEEGWLCDATRGEECSALLLDAIRRRRRFNGTLGQLVPTSTRIVQGPAGTTAAGLKPRLLGGEQSNTCVAFGSEFVLKLFRRMEEGPNPELEIGRFLTQETRFAHVPPMAGAIEYCRRQREPVTVAILQGFVPNDGDAWCYTLDALGSYFEGALAHPQGPEQQIRSDRSPIELIDQEMPAVAGGLIGSYVEVARLLGTRTAELHLALASARHDPMFAPEPFTPLYQRSLYQSMRSQAAQVFPLLRRRLPKLAQDAREEAKAVLEQEPRVLEAFQSLRTHPISAGRIRCHGDYHLGQVLYAGKDFVLFDFEGEPGRSISERRLKRSPLRDVAGMVRSFHYAAYRVPLRGDERGGQTLNARPDAARVLQDWAQVWYVWVSAAFLKAYLETARQGTFLPRSGDELRILLDAYLLEKAVYELGYELNYRPDWVRIPLRGIDQLVNARNL